MWWRSSSAALGETSKFTGGEEASAKTRRFFARGSHAGTRGSGCFTAGNLRPASGWTQNQSGGHRTKGFDRRPVSGGRGSTRNASHESSRGCSHFVALRDWHSRKFNGKHHN